MKFFVVSALLSILVSLGPLDASQRLMVLTVDDLPTQHGESRPGHQQVITDNLVSILQSEEIPAVGFVNESKLFREGELVADWVQLLEQWLDAGLELGNHTFSHPDLHKTPLEDFQEDLLEGEVVTRPLAATRDLPYRYFRHPYLHTGMDLEKKRAVEEFLSQHGYIVAPITIDNSEWIFAKAYEDAALAGNTDLQDRLGEEYLDYMLQVVRYYEDQSRGLFDREIPQILLIHANALNARYLEPLLAAIRERGYHFVDLGTALEDPAYQSPDTYIGAGGITWLHRWALTRGVSKEFFDGYPTTAEWVQGASGYEE